MCHLGFLDVSLVTWLSSSLSPAIPPPKQIAIVHSFHLIVSYFPPWVLCASNRCYSFIFQTISPIKCFVVSYSIITVAIPTIMALLGAPRNSSQSSHQDACGEIRTTESPKKHQSHPSEEQRNLSSIHTSYEKHLRLLLNSLHPIH